MVIAFYWVSCVHGATSSQANNVDLMPVVAAPQAEVALPLFDKQEFFKGLGSLLQDQAFVQLKNSEQAASFVEKEDGTLRHVKRTLNFCADYLEKYYPKVFVIRECFFLAMKPAQIAQALRDIVDVFTERPWFYFVDDQKRFNLVLYWEHIVDQCALLNQFLKNSRVDSDTNEVFFRELEYDFYECAGPFAKRTMRPLIDSIKKFDDTIIADFYALCFDYLIKLFNEGILLKDLGLVERYYHELEFVSDKLRATSYETDYQEVMRTSKELISLLKKKVGFDDLQYIEDWCGDDEEAKRRAYEEHFLGMS
ncbi:hypothetical protein IPF37_06085 [bacterium]|nr:MAG: hypothetical protein IPF37_06085 [bacterium]